jgi:hypothetical protein
MDFFLPYALLAFSFSQHNTAFRIDKMGQHLCSESSHFKKNADFQSKKANALENHSIFIFKPNPIAATGNIQLRDGNDHPTGVPHDAYQFTSLSFFINEEGNFFFPHAQTLEISPPFINYSEWLTSSFEVTRDHPFFEVFQVAYCIELTASLLEGFGWESLFESPVSFDAHAMFGLDNSQFANFPLTTGTLEFGTGGVDDGEDSDVIFHYLFHLLNYRISGNDLFSPSFNDDLRGIIELNERQSLNFGLADWFSVTMTRLLQEGTSPFDWSLFDWDAAIDNLPLGETPMIRDLSVKKKYPNDLSGIPLEDSVLISTALLTLNSKMDLEPLCKLIFESLFHLPRECTFSQFVATLLEVDRQQFQEQFGSDVFLAFAEKGIFPFEGSIFTPELGDDRFRTYHFFNPNPWTVWLGQKNETEKWSVWSLAPQEGDTLDGMLAKQDPASSKKIELFFSSQLLIVVDTEGSQDSSLCWLKETHQEVLFPHVPIENKTWNLQVEVQAPYGHSELALFLANESDLWQVPEPNSSSTRGFIQTPLSWGSFPGHFDWFYLQYGHQSVKGFAHFFSTSNKLASAIHLDSPHETAWVPHIPKDQALFWSGHVLTNTQPVANTITLLPYDQFGIPLSPSKISLSPGERWVGYLDQIILNQTGIHPSHIALNGQYPFSGMTLFGTQNLETMAGANYPVPSHGDHFLPLFPDENVWHGLVLLNPQNTLQTVRLYHLPAQMPEQEITLNPLAKTTLIIEEEPEKKQIGTRWVRLESESPFISLLLVGAKNHLWLDALEGMPYP